MFPAELLHYENGQSVLGHRGAVRNAVPQALNGVPAVLMDPPLLSDSHSLERVDLGVELGKRDGIPPTSSD